MLNGKLAEIVRAIGVVKPEFRPGLQPTLFAEDLKVRGTGFWVKPYNVLVTAGHVVKDLLDNPLELGLLMVGKNGQYKRARILQLDHQHDIAVLQIAEFNGNATPQNTINTESADGLELAVNDPSIGMDAEFAGFPMGNMLLNSTHDAHYSRAVVSGGERVGPFGKRTLDFTATGVGGYSGSPVVVDGKVVGILTEGPHINGSDVGIINVVSWKHIEAICKLATS